MKQLLEYPKSGTGRSAYILDGAHREELDEARDKPTFSMELLYLLLPIIGAFILLFSVCCCKRTLKKMLHIPKVVVMGSYAVMQMERDNPGRAISSSSDSDSSDEDSSGDSGGEEGAGSSMERRIEEDRRREILLRREMMLEEFRLR